jgi:Flp pilus assembly protein CpaB
MKRRSWLWIVASVLLAVLAGVLAIAILRGAAEGQQVTTPVTRQPVVVAANSIAANSILRADSLKVEERQQIPSGAAVRVQDVLGAMTMRDIAAGEVILMQDVSNVSLSSGITDTHNLALVLGNDKIAVALPADDILSNWGAVLPGDHVDVLFTFDVLLETPMLPQDLLTNDDGQVTSELERDQSMDNVSVLALQDLEVLQIVKEPQAQPQGEDQQQQAPTTAPKRALVLKIDPQDAVVLKYLRDSVAQIDVALRSPDNSTLFDVQPVNINYLALRYGIVLPQPLQ